MTLNIQAIRERKDAGWPFGGAEEDTEAMLAEIERLRVIEAEFNRQIDALDDAEHEIMRKDAEIQELWEQKRLMSDQWLDHESTIRRKASEIERLQKAHEVEQGVSNELSARLNDAHTEIEHLRTAIQQVIPRMNDVGLFNSVEVLERALRGDSHDN